jgi:DNA-binding CsgD family transcriptional regulator
MKLSLEQAFEAIFDDGQFYALLDDMADKVGAKGFAAGWAGNDHVESMFAVKNDWSPQMIERYYRDYAQTDPWTGAMMARRHLGAFVNMSDLVADTAFASSDLYNELIRDGGDDTRYGAAVIVGLPEGGTGGITFYRGSGQMAFDHEHLDRLNAAAPDLNRLLTLKASLQGHKLAVASWRDAVNSLAVPVFVLNPTRTVVAANEAAETIVEQGKGLLLRRGRLHAALPVKQRELENVFQAALHGSIEEVSVFVVECGPVTRKFTVLSPPNPAGERRILLIGDIAQELGSETASLLRLRYRLSPAESRLMLALAAGASRKEIAMERNVSVETLRTQYRSAISKMNCRSLTEAIIAVRRIVPVTR